MASKLSIISGAAVRLGAEPVISLDEGSKAAITGANLYDTVLESVLSMTRWGFAKGKKQLAKLVATPLNEWSFAYQLPTDLITIIKVYPRVGYSRYEDKLYTNAGNGLAIDYLFRPTEEKFPPYFVNLMEVRMAMELALPVTGSRSVKADMRLELMGDSMHPGALALAFAADAREYPAVPIIDSPLTDVRR